MRLILLLLLLKTISAAETEDILNLSDMSSPVKSEIGSPPGMNFQSPGAKLLYDASNVFNSSEYSSSPDKNYINQVEETEVCFKEQLEQPFLESVEEKTKQEINPKQDNKSCCIIM